MIPDFLLAAVLFVIVVVGFVGVLVLLAIALVALLDFGLKKTKAIGLFWQWVMWKYRQAPHPDLAKHIRRSSQAKYIVLDLVDEVGMAIENLRESQPGHICIERLEKVLKKGREYIDETDKEDERETI